MFYYASCPLIDQAPQNEAISLTMYTMHSCNVIQICYIYIKPPWEAITGMALRVINSL